MIPRTVQKVCESGWKTHIPYTNLTDAACHNEYMAMQHDDHVLRIGAGGKAVMTAPDLPSHDPAEALLGFIEYLQAAQRHILLIREYQPENQAPWHKHIEIVFNHLLRDTHWPILLRYDIEIRKQSCNGSIDQGRYQKLIFDHQMELHRDRAVNLFQPAPPAAPQKSFQLNITATHTATPRNNNPSSRNNQKTTLHNTQTPSSSTPGPHGKCFRCGGAGHGICFCMQDTFPNGRATNIVRTGGPKGPWTFNGKTFCYKFNSIDGCTSGDCQNPPHICTLCKSGDHGAQNCRA
jgi:hypothetical protein